MNVVEIQNKNSVEKVQQFQGRVFYQQIAFHVSMLTG